MDYDPFGIALKLRSLGYSVIPSGAGDKHKAPAVNWTDFQKRLPTEKEIQDWQKTLAPPLWGIVTGTISGLVVVDADTTESRTALEGELGRPHVVTPRGGGHWYFRHPGTHIKTAVAVIPDVDIRGDGGFVNIIGSRPDGKYQLQILPDKKGLLPWDKLPERIRQRINGSKPAAPIPADSELLIPEGQRNAKLASIAGGMRRHGLSQEVIETALLRVNASQCEIPLPEREVIKIAGSIGRYEPRQGLQREYNLTDAGNAEYFTEVYGDRLRYDHQRGRWLVWHKHLYKQEKDGFIMRLALKAARDRYQDAVNVADLKERENIAKWAIGSEQRVRLEACIAVARSLKPIADSGENWDAEPWLFCGKNGVIDLRTGELRPGQPADRITMQSPIEYDPGAACREWHKFLDRATDNNAELKAYLQRAVGYSLTGHTKSQVLFFLYGLGSNGKTTFITTIRKLMGDYGERVNTDLFMLKDKNYSGPKEGLANLHSKRFVAASELEDGKQLAVSLIKDMTGGESIKADRKYEHEIEYTPTHKLWLVGNHKPVVKDTTLSIWRRVKLIPFTVTITDKEIDEGLPSKLEAELPGVLNWAIDGCLEWQKQGLNDPEVITTATAAYRAESDILGDFIEDCCILEPLVSIPKSELKESYQNWCKDNSVEPVSQRTFRNRLMEKGVTEGRIGRARLWRGIRLLTDDDFQKNDDDVNDKSDKTNGNFEAKVTKGNQVPESPHTRNENKKVPGKSLPLVTNVTNGDTPPYPVGCCPECGSDAWGLNPEGTGYYCTNCKEGADNVSR